MSHGKLRILPPRNHQQNISIDAQDFASMQSIDNFESVPNESTMEEPRQHQHYFSNKHHSVDVNPRSRQATKNKQ
jgi:hypothetical protein